MGYSTTLFKSAFDNKTHKRMDFQSFSALEALLYTLSKRQLKGKRDAELISPATYKTNTTRANANVLTWASWCAVDVDDVEIEGDLNAWVRNLVPGWRFICYSTASSRSNQPKFRLVFDLGEEIETDRIKHFWYALNKELGGIGDTQTKDLSRMYYIPATYDGANNFIFTGDGSSINVNELLAKHPYVDRAKSGNTFLDRLPPELAEQVVNHRKNSMQNTNVVWSSFHDCPFWPRRLASEYVTISETGWYHKMYQMMVAIAARALEKEYPISAGQIADLCKQFDNEHGGWYADRPIEKEADRALEYAYRNT